MPTIISHSVVAIAGSFGFKTKKGPVKLLLLGMICSIIPDADVAGYHWLHVSYNSFFGHRGFFHSPFFAALFSAFIVLVFFRHETVFSKPWWKYYFYFFLLTASHGLLDAMTNGGRGIALLSPFSSHRYFFPWTPIEVSPLGLGAFFSQRGLTVLKVEFLWIWIPAFLFIFVQKIIRPAKERK